MQYQESFPDDTWTLEQLAAFCTHKLHRWATDAWLMGQAFTLAKAKAGQGKWGEWQKDNNFSPSMTERYMKLRRNATLEELEGLTLTEACRQSGININGHKKETVYVETLGWAKPVADHVPDEPESVPFEGTTSELPNIEPNRHQQMSAAKLPMAGQKLHAKAIPSILQNVRKMLAQAFIDQAEGWQTLPAGRQADVRERALKAIEALDDLLEALKDDGAELALAA